MTKKTLKTKPYKEPVFLFTSSSLRHAAWAGWYSAFGDRENSEKWIHSAHAEWAKELGAGRRFSFLDRYSLDIWKYVPPKKLKQLVDSFFRDLGREIKKGKKKK